MSRGKGEAYGAHRVLEPKGVLPQAAARLDASLPIYDNEVLIEVKTLNIDSASFHQMKSVSPDASAIGAMLLENVKRRGKQVNPVTGSGGMLIGEVIEVGHTYTGPCALKIGDRVATLISLTLTPLHLEEVLQVHVSGPREAQVDVRGHAILVQGAPAAKLPSDLPESLALGVLDVCGAPAQVDRLVKPGLTVLMIGGGGKSGLLCLHQAREKLGKTGKLLAIDYSEASLNAIKRSGLADHFAKGDARDALAIAKQVSEWTGGRMADLVFNTTNVAHTEMACILAAREGGIVYYFNMATDFARAALGSEGVGRDVQLLIGNGFTPGHAELSLDIVRKNKILFQIFSEIG